MDSISKKFIEGGKITNELEFTKSVTNVCRNYGLEEIAWVDPLKNYIFNQELPGEILSSPCLVFDRVQIGEDEEPDNLYENKKLENWPTELLELKPESYSHPVIIRVTPYASKGEIIDFI